MGKLIEKLTPEQEARYPEFIKKWTDIGLCTKPANRELAEEGVREAYRNAGLDEPKIVWCDSPLSMALTRSVIKQFAEGIDIGAGVRASVWDSVWDSVRASVWDSVWDSVRDSVAGRVWARDLASN